MVGSEGKGDRKKGKGDTVYQVKKAWEWREKRQIYDNHHFSQSRDNLAQCGQRLVDVGTFLWGHATKNKKNKTHLIT